MGVLAQKIIVGPPDYIIERNFECGTFDLLQESQPGNGWSELSRDCDAWPQARRTLYPYASGNNGKGPASPPTAVGPAFRKYFPETTDAEVTTLSFLDVNGGVLPADMCAKFLLYQNGKKLPCEAYTTDYALSVVTIAAAWAVPGASYEGIYEASVSV